MNSIKILILSLLLTPFICKCQNLPPPPALPTIENKALIEKIIKITRYEDYFYNKCIKRIKDYGLNNAWDSVKINIIIKSINFEDFNSAIFNFFARNTKNELESIFKIFMSLNENNSSEWLIANFWIRYAGS